MTQSPLRHLLLLSDEKWQDKTEAVVLEARASRRPKHFTSTIAVPRTPTLEVEWAQTSINR